MLFLTNEAEKKPEIDILTFREVLQGLGTRSGAPWVAISGVYKAAYITCTSSRLTNHPLFGFSLFLVYLFLGATYSR